MPFYKTRDTLGDAKWFVKDRFGMFIHFGLYSLAARHEWLMTNECMTGRVGKESKKSRDALCCYDGEAS